MDDEAKSNGLTEEMRHAMGNPNIIEISVSHFAFQGDGLGNVRIVFGKHDAESIGANPGSPIYTHAVTLRYLMALELADKLLRAFAMPAPKPDPAEQS